jgi:protein phosphatase
MSLKFTVGQSSLKGPRPRNEDYIGLVTPAREQLNTKGAIIAVADGVSGNAGGGEAAEMTVRTVTTDYYATPDTWEPLVALDKILTAANRWLIAQANANRDMIGMATTLSLLLIRGRHYYSAHVGDTRIYLYRQNSLTLLTTDHVWDRPDMRHVLKRAVGLDQNLTVDFSEGEILANDIFLIMSDGVWGALEEKEIHRVVGLYDTPSLICSHLTKLAIDKGGQDNSTAVAIKIDEVGQDTLSDLISTSRNLIAPEKLSIGDVLDGFEVVESLHESRATIIYKVKHVQTNQTFVLKTLHPLCAKDKDVCASLLNEEWLSKRVVSQYFAQVFPVSAEKRSKLYFITSWHDGATLQQRLDSGHYFTISGVAKIGADIVRGIAALHRLNIIHRDIKPANLHQGSDQRLRILDLGVAMSSSVSHKEAVQNPGTPSFMAPELFAGEEASVRSDLYAIGVTLYYLLTRKYPHGEIEPFQNPRFGDPIPPSRYRPETPKWLENIILKAIARLPEARFETAEEMLLALEYGELKPVLAPARTPLVARARFIKWQWIAIFSLLLNFLFFYLLIIV